MPFDRIRASAPALLVLFLHVALGTACAARETESPIIEFVEPAAEVRSEGALRVATANMWGVSVLGFDWAREIDARFEALAERLARNEPRIDVVLIQEAWKDSARRALLTDPRLADRFPYRVDIATRPGGAGLVVLSRIPLEAARFHRYRAQGNCLKFWEGDCLSGKGVAFVRARIGDRSVWIGNTHLIACYAPDETAPGSCDEDDPNGLDRWHQLEELRQVISDLVGDDPILVAGDFNFTRSSRYYAHMQASTPESVGTPMKDSMADAPGRFDWTEAGEATDAGGGLDFIWMRSGKDLRWHAQRPVRAIFEEPVELPSGESMPLSDHPILAGEFCLVPSEDPGHACVSSRASTRDPSP